MTDEVTASRQQVRSEVRSYYGRLAEEFSTDTASDCCSPRDTSCGCSSTGNVSSSASARLYTANEVAELPEEVTGMSLGCGDPVTLASLEPGQTVLDLGSGGGLDCFLAAQRVGETGQVIGVDMTPRMIETARANKAKLGVENVDFRLGEIEHLPVEDESVDVVISNCVINLSPDKPQVFRDAFRALRPGGRLAVSDIVTGGPLPQVLKDDLSAWVGCVAGALEVEEYVAAVEQAGFVDVTLTPTYLDGDLLEEAVHQLDIEIREDADEDGKSLSLHLRDGPVREIALGPMEGSAVEALGRAVFSAKVTARKPVAA